MVLHVSHLTIPEHLMQRKDTALDQPPLLQRAEAARWAVAELGADPYLALLHAMWPPAGAEGRPPRYAD